MFGLTSLNDYLLPRAGAAVKDYVSAYGSSYYPNVTLPTEIAAGDTIIVFIGSNYGVSVAPSGFTTLDNKSGSYHSSYSCYKVATGTEGGTTIQATCSGSQQWNIWAVVVSRGIIFGHAGNRASNGTTLVLGSAGAVTGKLVLVFASARVDGKELTSDTGTKISSRTADAVLSSAFFAGYATAASVSVTIGSPSSTQGMAGAFVAFA